MRCDIAYPASPSSQLRNEECKVRERESAHTGANFQEANLRNTASFWHDNFHTGSSYFPPRYHEFRYPFRLRANILLPPVRLPRERRKRTRSLRPPSGARRRDDLSFTPLPLARRRWELHAIINFRGGLNEFQLQHNTTTGESLAEHMHLERD